MIHCNAKGPSWETILAAEIGGSRHAKVSLAICLPAVRLFSGRAYFSTSREEEIMGLGRISLVLGIVCISSPALAQLYSITTTGQLFTVNTSNAATTFVGNTGIPLPGSLEFRSTDGFLYCMEIGGNPGFWRINPTNAAATLVGNPGVFIFEGGLQFAPTARCSAPTAKTPHSPNCSRSTPPTARQPSSVR